MKKSINTNLLGKDVEVYLPRFYFWRDKDYAYFGSVNDMISGFIDDITCDIKDNFRHISMGEFVDLLKNDTKEKHVILGESLLAYFLKRGFDLKDHKPKYGIYTNNGIRREGEDLIIFKNIDDRIENITESAYDTTVGYKINDNIENEKFNVERLFRKYDEKNLTLKEIEKSNPDLIEYLFSKEYEELPEVVQNSKFILPPDYLKLKEKDKSWCDEECNIQAILIDISSTIEPEKSLIDNKLLRVDIGKIPMGRMTIYPDRGTLGMHLLVREVKR